MKKRWKRQKMRENKRSEKRFLTLAMTSGAEGKAPEWIQLLPRGEIVANGFLIVVDDQSLEAMVQRFESRENDVVLDYEHQTLDGVEAPAAGWIVELEAKEDGLWGKVEWTERGREYVESREYRYLSPVVSVNEKDHRGIQLQSAALTNHPAIDGMQPVVAKENEGGTETMEFLKSLAELVGLDPETATEEEVLAAIQGMMRNEEEVPEELAEVLELEEGEVTIAAAKKKIYAMKAGRVPAGELAAVNRQLAEMRAEKTVEIAMREGKITPAQKNWATKQAAKDPKGFAEYLATAPKVVSMTEISGGVIMTGNTVSAEQREINRKLRISEDDMKKFGGK